MGNTEYILKQGLTSGLFLIHSQIQSSLLQIMMAQSTSVQPPGRNLMNKAYELYEKLEESNAIAEACASITNSARDLCNLATNTTRSPSKLAPGRAEITNWLQSLASWEEEADDIPNLDSIATSPRATTPDSQRFVSSYQAVRVLLLSWKNDHPQAINRTKIMRNLEDLFRDTYNFVVYSYEFQQPTNPAETIDRAFFSWLMTNNFLLNINPKNHKELVIIIYDGVTGKDTSNNLRLYNSQNPTRNSLLWDPNLQTRFVQAPFDTLQIFNATYQPPNQPVRNSSGTNLVLAASDKDIFKSNNWQLLFLEALYTALLPTNGPLSIGAILERIRVAYQEKNLKEVRMPNIVRLPSDGDDTELNIAPLEGADKDGWVVLSHHDYWSQRQGGGR